MSHIYVILSDTVDGVEKQRKVLMEDFAQEILDTISSRIDPAIISADLQNYNPTDWSKKNNVFLDFSSSVNIGGFAALPDLTERKIHNKSAHSITIVHMDTNSMMANRVICDNGTNTIVAPYASIELIYDAQAQSGTGGWRFSQ